MSVGKYDDNTTARACNGFAASAALCIKFSSFYIRDKKEDRHSLNYPTFECQLQESVSVFFAQLPPYHWNCMCSSKTQAPFLKEKKSIQRNMECGRQTNQALISFTQGERAPWLGGTPSGNSMACRRCIKTIGSSVGRAINDRSISQRACLQGPRTSAMHPQSTTCYSQIIQLTENQPISRDEAPLALPL